jgi:hypothetical protein
MTAPAEPTTEPTEPDPPAQADPPVEPKEPDWKAEARKWEQRAKENKQAKTDLEKLQQAAMSDQEKAVAAARAEASTETATRYHSRIVSAEIRAAAGGKLADPSDAVRLLDLSQFTLDDSDEVDQKAVQTAIDDLLRAKPYLGVKDPPRFQGGADQGPRGNGEPLSIDDQIREAETAGDARLARALKAQKLTQLPPS